VKKISVKQKKILGKIGDEKKGEICMIKYLVFFFLKVKRL
jgi:hypothetical protein